MEEKHSAPQPPFLCVIPARFQSSRFPGKPLAPLHGVPMMGWVTRHATGAARVKEVIVATDHQDIQRAVEEDATPARAMLTPDLPSGSDRVAHVAATRSDDWVFEMQGDQPLVTPSVIDAFIDAAVDAIARNPSVEVVIPYAKATEAHTASPDVLKVVVSNSGRLLFQTRQPIQTGWRTLGLYLWRRDALLRFAALPRADIEQAEDSHPIRLYVNDFYVQGIPIDSEDWVEVDRPHHITEVEEVMRRKGLV